MALVGSPVGKPWGRRLPVSVGGVVGKTYAEFQAQINSLATGGAKSWSGDLGGAEGAFKTTADSAASGTMAGSPWLSSVGYQAPFWGAVNRVIQHSLPSQAEFNNQISATRDIFFRVVAAFDGPFSALDRNGYLSQAQAGANGGRNITEVIYWDGFQAQRMVPNAGTGPTPYTW